jgi:hypothetical protein
MSQRRTLQRVSLVLLLLRYKMDVKAWNPVLDRRSFSAAAATTVLSWPSQEASAATGVNNLVSRFENDMLKQPPVSMGSELNGVDNMHFPSCMQGTWQVTQTLVSVSTPLGLAFAGGPNGLESIAERTIEDSKIRLNIPVQLQLRCVPTKWGVAEDRLFNTRQRLDAFAGRSVVASVGYANVGGSNRASVLAMGGTEDDPLQTTLVRFKGPVAQKTFVTGHSTSTTMNSDNSWTGYEMQRSIFALTNQNTAPPITTDEELLWSFKLLDGDHVQGRFRIAGYLNPTDKLYFDARNRAVSLQDYTLDMNRIGD